MSGSDPTPGPGDAPSEEEQGGGITVGRAAVALFIAVVVLVVLFTWVFPWIERNLSNPTLQALALLR